jgi:hypothetical protein
MELLITLDYIIIIMLNKLYLHAKSFCLNGNMSFFSGLPGSTRNFSKYKIWQKLNTYTAVKRADFEGST